MKAKDNGGRVKLTLLQKLKRIGLAMAGVGAAVVAAPITLPLMVVTAGGYIAVAGGILVAAAQPLSSKLKSLF